MRFLLLCFLSCGFIPPAQAQTTETFLYGTWVVEKISDLKDKKSSLPDSIKRSYENASFIFKPDNRFALKSNSSALEIDEAAWKYERGSKTILVSLWKNKETMDPVLLRIKLNNTIDGKAQFVLVDQALKLRVKNAWRTYMPFD